MGVGANTTIRRAIVDKNARIGDNVRLVNQNRVETADGDNYFIRDGIIIIPKNATIRDNTVI
jgi:glucose-1-phosphate adenylyltransferase